MTKNIETILQETRLFPPPRDFEVQANVAGKKSYDALCDKASADYEGFWGEYARTLISWETPFTQVLDSSEKPFYHWFADGKLNISYNCLDRHLETKAQKIALIFEADDGSVEKITYAKLHEMVCRFANALKSIDVKPKDRVVIYLPMSVEAVVAMQACARIGAIHSVVFAGFAAKSLHERIVDVGAKIVITADGSSRGGKKVDLKATVDEALDMGGHAVQKVIVAKLTHTKMPWRQDRDLLWEDAIAGMDTQCEPYWQSAEDLLFVLYTSGSTGKPKGIMHSSGGYLLSAILSMLWVFDYKENDIFWCTADVGWITGHTYIAYGPLALGATQVVFAGVPTYPDAGRFWEVIEKHKVTVFYTAPTAIRMLIKLGADLPKRYDLSSLRLLGSVGEPINPEAWMWYHKTVGQKRCPVVDTWWQTETGSHMIAPLPGALATKPGSCTLPLPGIMADIVDEQGQSLPFGQGGYLVIKKPFPSMARGIWGDSERFVKAYFPKEMQGAYVAGDSAYRDNDGYFWILGRIDDVLNVSGHRLGTMEIESALVAHPAVAEAAVVGIPDPIKGESIVAYVLLKEGAVPEASLKNNLKNWVAHEISPIAKPDEIYVVSGLPKTRSGKIMRRLIRAIAQGEPITSDVSTLENPAILEELQKNLK